MSAKATYQVTTWDSHKGRFTSQQGIRRGPWTKWGLRRALRALRDIGYDTDRHGVWVLVERR